MLSWSRPDPLTRDLVHLINARRHDHGDTDAAIDTLQAFLEQGREYDLLTVLAALDEDMAEWLFDLLAEASCSVLIDGPADDKLSYAVMAAVELPLQANLAHPLKLKIDPVATAELLHRHLRLSAGDGRASGVALINRFDAGAAQSPGVERSFEHGGGFPEGHVNCRSTLSPCREYRLSLL